MKYTILLLALLTGCATQGSLKIYGKMPNNSYVIAQMCIKDKEAKVDNIIRYSVLFKMSNAIRKFEDSTTKKNGTYFYSVPLGESRNLTGFLLPLEYKNLQYFGFMWDLNKNSVSTNKWTQWSEPDYTVSDISDTNFKVDNGLIGREDKSDSTQSPYLARFKVMDIEDYIRNYVDKWGKDPVPKCE